MSNMQGCKLELAEIAELCNPSKSKNQTLKTPLGRSIESKDGPQSPGETVNPLYDILVSVFKSSGTFSNLISSKSGILGSTSKPSGK